MCGECTCCGICFAACRLLRVLWRVLLKNKHLPTRNHTLQISGMLRSCFTLNGKMDVKAQPNHRAPPGKHAPTDQLGFAGFTNSLTVHSPADTQDVRTHQAGSSFIYSPDNSLLCSSVDLIASTPHHLLHSSFHLST